MSELNEVFDEDGKSYPVVNLKPKLKVPQLWSVALPGNDELVVRMVSYMTEGDALKQVKLGDKYAHVILMSLSKNGTPAELRGGLGADPIGAMRTIFQTVYENVKKLHMDAVMFRFPAKKMKGQEKAIQRVIARLCMSETGGRFVPLNALYQFTGKHAYVLIYRKSKPLESIAGIPEINANLYTKVDSDVGDVYVIKKTGESVQKDVAIAGSIAAVEAPRSDRLVINKTKFSREALLKIQTVAQDDFVYPKSKEFMNTASLLSAPSTGVAIDPKDLKEYEVYTSGKVAATDAIDKAFNGAVWEIGKMIPGVSVDEREFSQEYMTKYRKIVESGKSVNSIEAVKALTQGLYELIEDRKDDYINNWIKRYGDTVVPGTQKERALKAHNETAAKVLSNGVRDAVRMISSKTIAWYTGYKPKLAKGDAGAIKEYTTSSYDPINSYLLGRNIDVADFEAEEMIEKLDKAFIRSGVKLPEGTTLYRGQKLRRPFFEKLVETRMYMFRNFVSTSIYPIMLGGWGANTTLAMAGADEIVKKDDQNAEAPDFRDYTFQTNALGDPASPEFIDKLKYDEKVSVGWVIYGADKINSIIPGSYSAHASECEVILPRGLVVSVDKITSSTLSLDITQIQRMIEATVMTSEQISEAVVYDGDHLLETGEHIVVSDSDEVEPVSFASFTKAQRIDFMKVLAGIMDLDTVPEKFVL